MMTEIFTGDQYGEVAITEQANGSYLQIESRVASLKKGWHLVIDKDDGEALFCARLSDDFDSMWMLWSIFMKFNGAQKIPYYTYTGRHQKGGDCMSMGEAIEGLLAFAYSEIIWGDEWVTRSQEMHHTSYKYLREAGSIF